MQEHPLAQPWMEPTQSQAHYFSSFIHNFEIVAFASHITAVSVTQAYIRAIVAVALP